MPLDLENPEVQAEVEAIREEAIAEATAAIDEKYAGLTKNHEEVVADRKAASAKAKEYQEELERYKSATQGRDIDDVENTFTSIEKADYESLLGKQKFDEAYDVRAKGERKEFAKAMDAEKAKLTEYEKKLAATDEQLIVLTLDNVAVEKFLSAKGHKSGLRDMKSRIRTDVKRDENGEFYFPDQFNNPKKDSKGEQMTIDSYIDEVLRIDAPHLFPEMVGSGAAGSSGGKAGGGKPRSAYTSAEAGAFIKEHGVPAWAAKPAK